MSEGMKVPPNSPTQLKETSESEKSENSSDVLMKWKKSAALFQPNTKNHNNNKKDDLEKPVEILHDKDVLEAAEALTCLSRANRT
ncbi:hypothetical protein Phum_PHUM462630 [Pediculus humanus corporis]|uniref:Uncharacterized protein n=1 Tax=Pediculus humanus subsp. corporis TaxID=121224 RepID=E0VVE9_PEDHC|nr:uncharacterized protein Phum_PHUM462630 [Pediculus humanus corporis]EEB17355.1 hypothetical protein Phum_PHUM462630 [Pediculus humanus corporis]